jgi:3-oxo-5-alpha-steroid 4-dehydrogenase 1
VYPAGRRADTLFWLGAGIWAAGWTVNLHSDALLRGLRRPGETGYRIPVGGAFEFVSAANYCGEIVEWAGFALACRSLPAAAFAAFTFANLAPRGAAHHAWYIKRFEDYPRRRRAVLPFVW